MKSSLRQKGIIGVITLVLFLLTATTGIMLHMKAHGIVIQPRAILKVIHWCIGIGMVALTYWHGKQFFKMLKGIRGRYKFFHAVTWIFIITATITVITGLVKLLSPVKIHGLGLFHYQVALIMSITAILHLIHTIPTLPRYFKQKGKN